MLVLIRERVLTPLCLQVLCSISLYNAAFNTLLRDVFQSVTPFLTLTDTSRSWPAAVRLTFVFPDTQ